MGRDLLVELGAEFPPTTRQPALHRAGGNAELPTDFLGWHVEEVVQDQGLAVVDALVRTLGLGGRGDVYQGEHSAAQFSYAGVGVLIPKYSGDQFNTGRKVPTC